MTIFCRTTRGTVALAIALSASAAFANKDHEGMFREMDANGDGVLTKGELTAFMMDEKGKSARKGEKKSAKKIDKFDSNEDGALSRQEFTDGMNAKFAKADANKDGFVNKEEMKEAH